MSEFDESLLVGSDTIPLVFICNAFSWFTYYVVMFCAGRLFMLLTSIRHHAATVAELHRNQFGFQCLSTQKHWFGVLCNALAGKALAARSNRSSAGYSQGGFVVENNFFNMPSGYHATIARGLSANSLVVLGRGMGQHEVLLEMACRFAKKPAALVLILNVIKCNKQLSSEEIKEEAVLLSERVHRDPELRGRFPEGGWGKGRYQLIARRSEAGRYKQVVLYLNRFFKQIQGL